MAERTADLATAQSLLVSAPELHHTPERLRRERRHEPVPGQGTRDLHHRHPLGGRGPPARRRTPGERPGHLDGHSGLGDSGQSARSGPPAEPRPRRWRSRQIATSGRSLDVLVGPAGTGKSTAMAGLRAVWETEHGAGSVLGLAPSAASAEALAVELGIDTENVAKWLHEHRQEAERLRGLRDLRVELRSVVSSRRRSLVQRRIAAAEEEVARWRLRRGQLVIVDEASLAGTFALDELVIAAA